MNKENYKNYADVKNQIKELENKAKEIEVIILDEMKSQEIDSVKSDFGTFSLTKRKTWKYTDEVLKLSDVVKQQKEKEETEGIATFEEKVGLLFRAKTNQNEN